jgi:hypothetical protein
MNVNMEMLGILIGISMGTWLLVNRVFLKSGVKLFVSEFHKRYLERRRDSEGKAISLEKLTRWSVSISVLLVATVLVVLTHAVNMYVVVEQVGEFQYAGGLIDATFFKCFLGEEPVKYSLAWYADIVLTIATIYSASKVCHRLEQYFGFKYDAAKPKEPSNS